MATAMAIENLFARQADLHGPAGSERGLGYDYFVIERIALATEAAAVGRRDHANVAAGMARTFASARCT